MRQVCRSSNLVLSQIYRITSPHAAIRLGLVLYRIFLCELKLETKLRWFPKQIKMRTRQADIPEGSHCSAFDVMRLQTGMSNSCKIPKNDHYVQCLQMARNMHA